MAVVVREVKKSAGKSQFVCIERGRNKNRNILIVNNK